MGSDDSHMLGEQLQEVRKDKRLTQKQLGEVLGVGARMVSRYECGDSLPTAQALITMSELFNVNIDFLLDRTRIRTSWSDYERQLKGKLEQGSETEQECLRLFQMLTEADKAMFRRLLLSVLNGYPKQPTETANTDSEQP